MTANDDKPKTSPPFWLNYWAWIFLLALGAAALIMAFYLP